MASTTEKGFGAKLQQAQNLINVLGSFQNYHPPRNEESVQEMQQLTADLEALNTSQAAQSENYRYAVDIRLKAFNKSPGSVQKLLSPIYSAVKAQFGKDAKEAVFIAGIIRKIRGTKLVKKPAVPSDSKVKAPISTSEQSYGSLTKLFGDLVTTLAQYPAYNPSNPELSVAFLQQKQQSLSQLSADVVSYEQVLRLTRIERVSRYEELRDRVSRIKQYVKAQYGNNSPEHLSVRSTKA